MEDLSYARSIRRSNVGVAAIISIVIGILASICFAIMILLALRRRRRFASAEVAPSSSAYTNTSRYTPDTSESAISDMKPTYAEELSPNVSSSDLHHPEVVLQMDGHQTIIGSYEEFLDVPTGARPNIFQVSLLCYSSSDIGQFPNSFKVCRMLQFVQNCKEIF